MFGGRKLLFIVASLFIVPAWADEAVPLKWVGCGITKKAFMQELAAAYERSTGERIDIEGGGATKGIRDVARLEADMGGSCRYLLAGTAAELGVKPFPVAWDALVAIVHPSNPVQSLTLDELRAVYNGEITNWSQLGGYNAPLELAVRKGKISGVGLTLRQLVFADENKAFVATHEFPSSGPLEQAIESNVNAIGVTGISSAQKRKVKILRLEDKEPNYANILNGEYLLYRPLYIIAKTSNPNYEKVRRFVDFANSREGRDIVRANGVVPYLEATHLIRKQLAQWRNAEKRRDLRVTEEKSRTGGDLAAAGE